MKKQKRPKQVAKKEEQETKATFDRRLKGLLSVPPPRKDKPKE